MSKRELGARRSTRLALQIPVILTSLDPAYSFRKECKTAIVNAHGCGVIVPQLLNNQTPVKVELVLNGATKRGRVVLAIPLENFSWFLGVEFDTQAIFGDRKAAPIDPELYKQPKFSIATRPASDGCVITHSPVAVARGDESPIFIDHGNLWQRSTSRAVMGNPRFSSSTPGRDLVVDRCWIPLEPRWTEAQSIGLRAARCQRQGPPHPQGLLNDPSGHRPPLNE